jgi:hypothetical protein
VNPCQKIESLGGDVRLSTLEDAVVDDTLLSVPLHIMQATESSLYQGVNIILTIVSGLSEGRLPITERRRKRRIDRMEPILIERIGYLSLVTIGRCDRDSLLGNHLGRGY